jgi:hypothetical protein
MDEGRGRGRGKKLFEDFLTKNAKNHIEMISIYFWWLCTAQNIIVKIL